MTEARDRGVDERATLSARRPIVSQDAIAIIAVVTAVGVALGGLHLDQRIDARRPRRLTGGEPTAPRRLPAPDGSANDQRGICQSARVSAARTDLQRWKGKGDDRPAAGSLRATSEGHYPASGLDAAEPDRRDQTELARGDLLFPEHSENGDAAMMREWECSIQNEGAIVATGCNRGPFQQARPSAAPVCRRAAPQQGPLGSA